ncbi:MAG: carboxypeptidase regulatory-like domain-containing protein, partial [Acidobacteriaceae bacterium]|nr:carboxypeptidase regulatory-like domain-containing protein [Acidobacteriaceae bacterium]
MPKIIRFNFGTVFVVLAASLIYPTPAFAQGETTSAIAGQVRDESGGVIALAHVMVTANETGLKRSVATDGGGRFQIPQLTPGIYTVQVTAAGFQAQENGAVSAPLGRTQTVDFVLRVQAVKQDVTVTEQPPLIDTQNANTSSTFNAPRLENLPNPGGDLTYPLQFAAGALINTAGSGNDFVGSTNGYGNVEFNGLPALSNGYIVDGLETNDPLTNLNSGLSTNLVLGLNSIAEVTVNTLSYSADQGRHGASQ